MPANPLPAPDKDAYSRFIWAQAETLRANDAAPKAKPQWLERKDTLRKAMFAAMGSLPEKPAPLEAKVLGVLKRPGYTIERLVFQSQPDVWVTANAYVPDGPGKKPAVLAVHGHWAGARREPTVQARCLGLAQLGFFVLCIDAFGSGERFTQPARGTYHGSLYGATLWPTGRSLLGMQVYDNRRAVDYLLTRDEVDGTRLGITGASGGGNQSMYAGALDERFAAVVPVCSVGSYQAYLRAACCVCEVLPGALRFTEEGDVLGLTAPRALLVISADKDAFQFNPVQAKPTIERAQAIYRLFGEPEKFAHTIIASTHDYNRPMREAMYGWMTRWLKNEGKGEPIPEPKIVVESPEDLACYPDPAQRPSGFLFPPSLAGKIGRDMIAQSPLTTRPPMHLEDWEATAVYLRPQLRKLLGDLPRSAQPIAQLGPIESKKHTITPALVDGESGIQLSLSLVSRKMPPNPQPVCVLIDLRGRDEGLKHPLAEAMIEAGWLVVATELRATGESTKEKSLRGAPDHNAAQHGVWIGRPLLGQWAADARTVLDWLAIQPGLDRRRTAVVGVGQAGLVAVVAAGLFEDRITSVAMVDAPTSLVTDSAYADGTFIGTLAPGILRIGDVPQLAALTAPRRLAIADGISPQGVRVTEKDLGEAFAVTKRIYTAVGAAAKLTIGTEPRWQDLVRSL